MNFNSLVITQNVTVMRKMLHLNSLLTLAFLPLAVILIRNLHHQFLEHGTANTYALVMIITYALVMIFFFVDNKIE